VPSLSVWLRSGHHSCLCRSVFLLPVHRSDPAGLHVERRSLFSFHWFRLALAGVQSLLQCPWKPCHQLKSSVPAGSLSNLIFVALEGERAAWSPACEAVRSTAYFPAVQAPLPRVFSLPAPRHRFLLISIVCGLLQGGSWFCLELLDQKARGFLVSITLKRLFPNTPARWSMKWLRGHKLIFDLIFVISLTLVLAGIDSCFRCDS
jgi:hypothetical protein